MCVVRCTLHGTRSAVLEMQSTGIAGGQKGSGGGGGAEDCMECVPRAFHVFILLPILSRHVINSCAQFEMARMRLKNAHICAACSGSIAKWERRAELIVCPVNYCHTN